MTKIALLSDIHGNTTALEAVLEDSRKAKVDEYWLLGDSLMPGTGRRALLELLEELPITVKVLGNWEDSLWRAMRGMLDETRPSHRYLMRQCQYILEEITPQEIEDMQKMPMQVHREIAGLKISITHHLPDKNWGRELIHIGEQKDFDRLVTNPSCDIAVYGHIHQQFFRYGTGGELIINPGSIGQPFFLEKNGEYIPELFDSPFLKDVTSHLLKTVPLTLSYQETGNNNLAYLAAFNSGMSSGIIPVTWGKINRMEHNVTFSSVIPDRFYFPVYYSPFGKSFSFGEPFYLNKEGKIEKPHTGRKINDVTLLRKFPMKQGLVNKAIKLIGTVVLASNKPGFNPCDTVGVITDTLYPYFQDIKLGMNKGPYQYYQIKTTNEYPHAALSELEFITDIRYGYKNTIPASSLPIFSPADTLVGNKFEVRLMDEPLEQIKWKAEYEGNPQTSPEPYPTIHFMLREPQFVTKVRMMPLNADNGIVVGNQYELLYWDNGEWKKILSQQAKCNYITVGVPFGSLLWLRNLTKGKEELPFYVDDNGQQRFIYML